MRTFHINNDKEYKVIIDAILSKSYNKALLILLSGELGSGKTTFTKHLAKSMGVEQNVISPTFILHREYKLNDNNMFHHLDIYRIGQEFELNELNIKNLLKKNNVVVIEWANNFSDYFNNLSDLADIITLDFTHKSESERVVKINI